MSRLRTRHKNSFYPFLIPAVLFLVLLCGHILMWLNSRSLIFSLVKSEGQSSAKEIEIRIESFLFERNKDLAHLASLWTNYPPDQRGKSFIKDAQGITSRERSYYSICFFNVNGKMLFRIPEKNRLFPPPDSILDIKFYLKHLSQKNNRLFLSEPFSSGNNNLIVIFRPAYEIIKGDSIFIGVVAGTLRLDYVTSTVIAASIPADFRVEIKVDTIQIYKTGLIRSFSKNLFNKKYSGSIMFSELGREWFINVYPPKYGLLNKLLSHSNYRFIFNISASLIVAILLCITLQLIFRERIVRSALEKSEERFRRLAENARDMIFRISLPDGKFEYVSPAAEQLTGYSPEDFYSAPGFFDKYVDPKWKFFIENQISEAIKGNIQPVLEFGILSKSGESRWVSQRNVVVYDKFGNPVAIEGIITDITEQKRINGEREKLILELERKNADLERFTYTISHELKTPLITIKGFLGYIEEEASKGDLSQLHKDTLRIISATETMQKLLNDLIELTRIGKLPKEPEEINTTALIKEAVKKYSDTIFSRKIDLRISENLPKVVGYYRELMELFQNLIENAIKFMGTQTKPLIEIGTILINGEILFFVRDNGIGIDPRYRERVFGLFNKLDSETEGTGVGLTLVKRIVELHGGWIRVESAGEGQGATFFLKLPLSSRTS